jgi:hypothetical protein
MAITLTDPLTFNVPPATGPTLDDLIRQQARVILVHAESEATPSSGSTDATEVNHG